MPKLNLDELFRYHAPTGTQPDRYARLREAAKNYAIVIAELTPESPEQTLALRAVHLASMHANSAIACNETAGPIPLAPTRDG
jgi:hypothetical protein